MPVGVTNGSSEKFSGGDIPRNFMVRMLSINSCISPLESEILRLQLVMDVFRAPSWGCHPVNL